MKYFILSICCLMVGFNSCSQKPQKEKAAILMEQLEILHRVDSIMLDNLPSTFEEYLLLWDTPACPLYNQESIIEHLSYSHSIDYPLFVKKIVDISVEAKTGVDHVYCLKDVAMRLVEGRLQDVIIFLNGKTLEENLNFWTFVFSSLHDYPSEEYIATLSNRVKRIHSPRYIFPEALEQGYDNSKKSASINH